MPRSKSQFAEYLVRFPARRDTPEIEKAFETQGPKSWVGERNERKFIRDNLHGLVQTWNSRDENTGNKASFRRCKNAPIEGAVQFCVDFEDESWLSVTYDPDRKIETPERQKLPDDGMPEGSTQPTIKVINTHFPKDK